MSNSVIFRLQGIHVGDNICIAVVGSSSSLGSWIPKKTCFLERIYDDTHELRVDLDDPTAEYKYVLLHGSEIQWEGGENRVIDTTAGNGECNDTWMFTGASDFIARTDAGDVPTALHESSPATSAPESQVHESVAVVDENVGLAQKTATEPQDCSSHGDRDTSEAKAKENPPVEEKLSPKKEQKIERHQSDLKSEQNCEPVPGETKKMSTETRTQRPPFLLLNIILKLCRRRATNTN